jgi:hypothetical protein
VVEPRVGSANRMMMSSAKPGEFRGSETAFVGCDIKSSWCVEGGIARASKSPAGGVATESTDGGVASTFVCMGKYSELTGGEDPKASQGREDDAALSEGDSVGEMGCIPASAEHAGRC